MSDTQKINWETPVHQQIANPNVPVQRINSHDDVLRRWKECENEGFGENAIVVRRYPEKFRCLQPYNWGTVTHITKHCSNHDFSKYKPLVVRWHANAGIGYLDMDELLLIQEPYDEQSLSLILDCQDPPWITKDEKLS